MKILHLAYEDYRQPGSGGGSIRTREINRRLARNHEITAVVTGYPGAQERVEDSVRWVPIGTGTGSKADRLSYFALLWREVLRRPHDLLVEDFGAPFGPGFSFPFTKKPVVAVVQWLFASQMREKYHLPFDMVERIGTRHYDRFVATSGWLAEDLIRRSPSSQVHVVPNGVEMAALRMPAGKPEHFVFVGRLDVAHKGLDLLLDVMRRVKKSREASGRGAVPQLLVIGEGHDRRRLEQMIRASHLDAEVRLLGRIEGERKYRLMADSYAVLMPSRYETFGMVAAEAQACGVPVVTFDVGPLREVVGGEENGAYLIRPFDTAAFADSVDAILDGGKGREKSGLAAREWARRYDWDNLAGRQERAYLQAVEKHRRR